MKSEGLQEVCLLDNPDLSCNAHIIIYTTVQTEPCLWLALYLQLIVFTVTIGP
jgi:hypothetical protein